MSSAWANIALGDERAAVLDRGVSWSKPDEAPSGPESVPIVSIPNVRSGRLDFTTKVHLRRDAVGRKLLSQGDILLVGSSGAVKNVGRSALVEEPLARETAFASFVVRVRPGPAFQPRFLSFCLQSPIVDYAFHSKKAADGKFNLQLESLRSQEIPLPPPAEQQRIAAVLSAIQLAIRRQERKLATLSDLMQSLGNTLVREPDWERVPFPQALGPRQSQKARKVLARDYLPAGRFPVIDQGQALIGGWTNDETVVLREGFPYVVFGDHTRTFKFIEFPFALGADGTQLLKASDEFEPRFFYYACQQLHLPSRGYNRHFRLLKEQELPRPPREEQKVIAEQLYAVETSLDLGRRRLRVLQELFAGCLERLMSNEISVSDLDIDTSEVGSA